MRISRLLALAGIDSRRKCEVHVRNGAVQVNGEIIRDLGRQVDPENDEVLYRGRVVELERKIYYVLNKPEGYTTTASDPHATKTVFDLLPKKLVPRTARPSEDRVRVFPVGRLDKNSMGLLLFTNDGDFANQMMHPRYGVGKWYEVKLHRAFDVVDGRKMLRGIKLEDGWSKIERYQILTPRNVRILIREGKNREVRRLLEAVDYSVLRLVRVSFGELSLGNLRLGEGRYLSAKEVELLKKETSLDEKKTESSPKSKKGK